MEDTQIGLIVMVAVIAMGALAYLSHLQEKKRREAFALLAQRLGIDFSAGHDFLLPTRYGFLDAFAEGGNRYAYNVLSGDYLSHPVQAFDYHYETYSTDSKGNRQTHHHHFSFFVLLMDRAFPELRIYPENFLSRIGQTLGFDDIDFESVEFSNAFTVRSKDKKFAYDVCNARMMEYLLANTTMSLEIEDQCIALGASGRLDPAQIPAQLDRLVAVRELMPEYLFA